MMRSLRRHWFTSRNTGSAELLTVLPTETPVALRRSNTKTEFELTSVKTKQLLEKGKYQKVVEMLRELSREFLLKCLESFPFKVLNRSIPDSFPVWETLLMKLHNSEDGYIPCFPYAACDKLVLQIGRLLECTEESAQENADLIHACKRVLKKVYMQYNGVLEPLYKELQMTEHAIYSLSLHLPLGTDLNALPLHIAIKEEITACITDYQAALVDLEELSKKEAFSLSQVHYNMQSGSENQPAMVEFHAPNPNQVQLQERLYFNQCIVRAMQPNSRDDSLAQLLELLNKRILGDKEVIAVFGNLRLQRDSISNTEPVEPWLRKHQRAMECSIAMLKEIEKALQITLPRSMSPIENGYSELSSSLDDSDIVPVPLISVKAAQSDELNIMMTKPSLQLRRSSNAPVLFNIGEKDGEEEKQERRYSSPPQHRPRSASPSKIRRANGMNGMHGATEMMSKRDGSTKSLSSCTSSNHSLFSKTNSSSIHDLNSTAERQPSLAFTRVQSLRGTAHQAITSAVPQHSRTLVAGKKKVESHNLSLLSTSTGNVSGSKPSKIKKLFRSGSGGLVNRWDTQQPQPQHDSGNTHLFFELELKSNELKKSIDLIHDLQRRERELTDRLSEQAQRQLLDSEKFEDILLGASRPTIVIKNFEELYSQARLEALDAVEALQIKATHQDSHVPCTATMDSNDTFNVQLMLDVLKFAYKAASGKLQQLHCKWKQLLGVPNKRKAEKEDEDEEEEEEEEEQPCGLMAEKQLESAITVYFRRVSSLQDNSDVVKVVMSKLERKFNSYSLYSEIKTLPPFTTYVEECVKVAWGLCIQTPPMTISCEAQVYNQELHKRFYNADKTSTNILVYMWPVLRQLSGPVLVRGVVLT